MALFEAVETPPRTLFIHVPKSGGTSLDSILSEHYHAWPSATNIRWDSDVATYAAVNETNRQYVSGHFPAGMADTKAFDARMTILRPPLHALSSLLSFTKQRGYQNPRFLSALENGEKFEIYREYFSAHFDLQRFLLDRSYGLAPGFYPYCEPCSVQEAVQRMADFDYVFDFNNLDSAVKTLLMKNRFFPYSRIARKRSYEYQPNYEACQRLVSDFDTAFYAHLRERFFRSAENVDARYESYREDYCRERGISLDLHQGTEISVRGPIGMGWHNSEISDNGTPYRWSDSEEPTVELPIARAGQYAVYFYCDRGRAAKLDLHLSTLIDGKSFTPSRTVHDGMTVFRCSVPLPTADWICATFTIDRDLEFDAQRRRQFPAELRTLGIVLRNVLLKRTSSQ